MQKTTINIQTNITLDFNTTSRGKLWKMKKSSNAAALPWGRAAQNIDKTCKNQTWDSIIEQSVDWTHMLTINIDPKVATYSNDSNALKKTLKTFFRTYSHLYTKLALVIEEGNGKWHAHALVRTTRSPTLIEVGIKEFSRNQNKNTQKAFFLIKINDRTNQRNCSTQWMGDHNQSLPNGTEYKHNGWPYLRKEKHNHNVCYLSA